MPYKKIFLSALIGAIAVAMCPAQTPDPDNWQSKLTFHLNSAYGTDGLLDSVVFAGYLQEINSPREWGQGATGYGKRLVSTMAYSGVRGALAFGLDTTLHQDPHYYPSGMTGTWRRTKYALHETLFTHRDSGGETLATWRLGSAYSAAFLANQWRPDRVNTTGLSLREGTTQLGFDALGNLRREFWPDIRKKLRR
jgi:YD repeat-containing protein